MDATSLANLAHKQSVEQQGSFNINIYNESNENLSELFNHYNIFSKNVLSVLGSSEQLFSCYVKGAKSVDTFDVSYVTLYYYYLRKWLITYKNKLYIPFASFETHNRSLYDFISTIKPKGAKEEEAKTFWIKYLKLNNYKLDRYLFSLSKNYYTRPFDGKVNILKNELKSDLIFYHLDISKEINIDKKYDVIILSNILEYLRTEQVLQKTRDNLEELLNDNGIIICSNLMNKNESHSHKREVEVMTSNKLVLTEEIEYYDAKYKKQRQLAYTYKKTR